MTEQSQKILADLRAIFGEKKAVLYADELAELLGKSTDAIYSLKNRDGFPIKVIYVGGRPAVSIVSVAEWLAGEYEQEEVKKTPAGASPVPPPKRKREELANLLRKIQDQREFLQEFYVALENVLLRIEIAEPDITNRDIGKESNP